MHGIGVRFQSGDEVKIMNHREVKRTLTGVIPQRRNGAMPSAIDELNSSALCDLFTQLPEL